MDDVYIIIEEMNNGDGETQEVWGIFKTKQDALDSLKQIYNEICDEAAIINEEQYPDDPPAAYFELIKNGEEILYSIWDCDTKYFIRKVHFGEHFDIWQL